MTTRPNAAARIAAAVDDRDRTTRAEPAPLPDVPAATPNAEKPPVRQTVDLTYERHMALMEWRQNTQMALGWKRLGNQEVFNAMIGLFLTDETVARRLRARIADADADPKPNRKLKK